MAYNVINDYVSRKNGKHYRVHVDKSNGKVIAKFPVKPNGYSKYDPNKKLWYKASDNGADRTITWQNGRKETRPGWAVKQTLGPAYYRIGQAAAQLKYQPGINQLRTDQTREKGSQDKAYRQIAGYYTGMANSASGLMDKVGKVGEQTNAQVAQAGQDRNAQITSATPQYKGPLGEIAQNMANGEQQAALNRGASVDSANRVYGAQTTGSRQAFTGQMGAAQQVAGQERLSTLKGQGQQALNVYGDKISQAELAKSLAAVDSGYQVQTADRTYGLGVAKTQIASQKATDTAAAAATRNRIAQQNADASTTRANNSGGSGGGSGGGPKIKHQTPAANNRFWAKVGKWNNDPNNASYAQILTQTGDPVLATVVRTLRHNGNRLDRGTIRLLQSRGYSVGKRYPTVVSTSRFAGGTGSGSGRIN